MKKPNIKYLKEDPEMTQKIRQMAASSDKIKITICIDKKALYRLKNLAEKNGSKYQTMLNHILKEYHANDVTIEERLTKLEEELKRIKNKLSKAA